MVLIVPCNHELAKQKSVKLNEIIKYPFINREETSGTRKEIERIFENNKFPLEQLKVALELGSTESVITAVSEGQRNKHNFLNRCKKAQAAGLVKIVKIEEAKSPRKLYMVRPKRPLLKTSRPSGNFAKSINSKMKLSHALQISGLCLCFFFEFNPDFARLNFPFINC